MPADTQVAHEIIQTIASAIVADPRYTNRDWTSIAIVAIIGDGVRQLSGYSFDTQGKPQPGTPTNDAIDDLFLDLQTATRVENEAPWVSALFQIKRDGLQSQITLEYTNPLRWKVNPARMAETIAALQP